MPYLVRLAPGRAHQRRTNSITLSYMHPLRDIGCHPLRPIRLFLLVLAFATNTALADSHLLWFFGDRPNPQALEAIEILQAAASEGLNPQDYDAVVLSSAVLLAQQTATATPLARQQLDAAITKAMQRYLSDLQIGRIEPRQIHADFTPVQRDTSDIPHQLRLAVDGKRLSDAVQQIASQLPMARPLREALASYRALETDTAWQTPLPLPDKGKLEPGQQYPALAELVRRLQVMGDLDSALPAARLYEGPLVDALERFQQRHGLDRDGVLGRLTLAQLNVTPGQRAHQIALTLERLRWTPYQQAPRMVVVNLPEFMLRAYEVDQGRVQIRLAMKISVGKALDTRTPLFDEDMRYIEFSPYWNVPRSIASRELVPRLRSDPAHFADQGFEFVTRQGLVVDTLSTTQLDAVMAGQSRIRQRPGPKNALGDIKFVLPNNGNIYLHHTPAVGQFSRTRRDLSHGCIRVEEPVALARFVLRDESEWTEDRIREAMQSGTSRTIRLKQPLAVLIAYSTVVFKQGMVHFFADLYGHDALLDQTLRARSATLAKARLQAAAIP